MELKVAAGSKILIGAPATPMHPDSVSAVTAAVSVLTGVQESHLPQCFIPGVSQAPAQVLVIVLQPNTDRDVVLAHLEPRLRDLGSRGIHVDVWPLAADHELLPAIRAAGCQITGDVAPRTQSPRKWWQFWRD